ncbi:uncharacterized protein LOC127811043 isoform X4 [Diospyros lotus]|uniref:uncharacterized protein LOC127811043 isoform X4 n=1 Tax=Diospyros lotus TaxID=55363 RepID=UPI00224EAA1E|nr:uncharacterized protein LOC127811043 isoform X4 [Diospyros lotus]XP_052206701.1 uncharacterized protein LOC127811043 isoform X4 [Diospyros lotus]XP_052206702.1 uncharacterized protein LOC127811043 isoform X4 [Diospyros lotus]
MDYSCKGALRLIHEEHAVKCFSMRGNKQCDVCGQEVSNLPVILLQPPTSMQRNNTLDHNQQNLNPEMVSVLEYFVTPMVISSFCYFCLLEQPLVGDMQNEVMVIALACAVTLDLLSSTFVILLAAINYIWTYAALQFALVATIIFLFHFSEYPVRRRGKTMQASDEITNSPPEDDARQGNLDRTPLLNSELEEVLETPVLALVRPASNLSPSVSAPVSASTPNTGLVQALESRFLFAEHLEIMRVMEDVVMLVVISSFFYFFVVQLSMADDMRTGKLLVALACAVILGVLSSTLALLLAMRYMWIYVALEFALVVVIFFTFHFLVSHTSSNH